jgi:hypothetical protein
MYQSVPLAAPLSRLNCGELGSVWKEEPTPLQLTRSSPATDVLCSSRTRASKGYRNSGRPSFFLDCFKRPGSIQIPFPWNKYGLLVSTFECQGLGRGLGRYSVSWQTFQNWVTPPGLLPHSLRNGINRFDFKLNYVDPPR